MKRTIGWQLIFSFLAISVVSVGLFGWLSMRIMNDHFKAYVSLRQTEEITAFTGQLEQAFAGGGSWDKTVLSTIGTDALKSNIILKVYDAGGQLIWAPSAEEEKTLQQTGSHMMQMNDMMGGEESGYTLATTKLYDGGKEIGSLAIGTIGPYAYTEHDRQFMTDVKNNFLIVALLTLVLSILFAGWVARQLSRPVVKVSDFTKEIAKGNYADQVPQETKIVEIDELIHSVNQLSHQLEDQQAIRNRLSSDISHEIRTPLTTLKGNLEAMLDGIWEITENRLRICYDEVNRISRLIGDIDRINEIESHHEKLTISSFDLQELSKKIVTNFASAVGQKNIALSVSGERVMIAADRDKISQVLTNLLSNAIKFTPENGEIEIETRKQGEQAILKVSDNGIGISLDNQEKIFERFYMTEPSRNSKLGGQGIGLAIVKSIVKKHKGTVRVESNPDKGATFIVSLPLE
jgi:two-component system, OmpR family, sensor histidine kinase BaeS